MVINEKVSVTMSQVQYKRAIKMGHTSVLTKLALKGHPIPNRTEFLDAFVNRNVLGSYKSHGLIQTDGERLMQLAKKNIVSPEEIAPMLATCLTLWTVMNFDAVYPGHLPTDHIRSRLRAGGWMQICERITNPPQNSTIKDDVLRYVSVTVLDKMLNLWSKVRMTTLYGDCPIKSLNDLDSTDELDVMSVMYT